MGNWPEDEFGRFGTLFEQQSQGALSDLERLRADVDERKHPWGWRTALMAAGTLGSIFILGNIWSGLGWAAGLIGGGGTAYGLSQYGAYEGKLKSAKSAFEKSVYEDALGVDVFDPSEDDPDILMRYGAAGFYDEFDTAHHLTAFTPSDRATYDPVMAHTHLTRTEIEYYTDRQGRQKQRERIVQVFNGLLFSLPFPAAKGPERLRIATHKLPAPYGPFERRHLDKRLRLSPIKPASPQFQKMFKVSCDDQTLGHEILHPDRVMRFINLYKDLCDQFDDKRLPVSMLIMDGTMWIAIETGKLRGDEKFYASHDSARDHITKMSRDLSVPQVFASHLKLPMEPDFQWQHPLSPEAQIS